MYTIENLLAEKPRHNHRTEHRAVYEAVNKLADELFTGIDIATFLTADRKLINQAIADRFQFKNNPGCEERNAEYERSLRDEHPKMRK